MDRPIAVIDIGSAYIKLLVGYELGGLPIVIYAKKVPTPYLAIDGQVDRDILRQTLETLSEIHDEDIKLNLSISEISLLLPNSGLVVYDDKRSTIATNVDGTGCISRVDVANVTTMIKGTPLPDPNARIVDIIPELFILSDGSSYIDPPIGKPSNMLTIHAKFHTLPKSNVDQYTLPVQDAGFHIKRIAVSALCQSYLFSSMGELPDSYLLVDYGHTHTSISLIGEGSPYSSISFPIGSSYLTQLINEGLNIDMELAENLKTKYGYDPRKCDFITPIYKGEDMEIYQDQLNSIIQEYADEYLKSLQTGVTSLLSNYGAEMDGLPILLTGGGSLLKGLSSFFPMFFPNRQLFIPIPRCIGARDPAFSGCLGMIIASSRYGGTLQDNVHGTSTLERENSSNSKKKKAEKRKGDSSLDDNL